MVNIEKIKTEIIERLKPLKPDKIILFGSYAYGKQNEDSDIDLFLIKNDLSLDELDDYEIKAKMQLLDLMDKYQTNGIDILSAPLDYIKNRDDYFYKVEILEKGKIIYEQTSSN